MVGLPDATVREARERIRAAIKNSGFKFPISRITTNLAPAGAKKTGTLYDLPMLIGILVVTNVFHAPDSDSAFIGELSLEGSLRPVNGILSMALAAEKCGIKNFMSLLRMPVKPHWQKRVKYSLTLQEKLEVTQIYSAVGKVSNENPLICRRPFRSPHHTISAPGLSGGGSTPRPGEVSLADCGVLFLDELPEFHNDTLEVMRQPPEDGHVTISRISGSTTYPSRFMLVCAMNPCKCGWYGDPSGRCTCTQNAVDRYHSTISGPLLD